MPTHQPRSADQVLAAAKAAGPILDAEAEASETKGSLTDAAFEALNRGRFNAMAAPREFGGDELDFVPFLRVIEELARADGPSGWCAQAMAGYAGLFESALPEPGAAALAATGELPWIAGQAAPRGRADRVAGGYDFTGRFQFASGANMATHFAAGALVYRDGVPSTAGNGLPETIIAVLPRSQVTELDNWNVNGMESTSSIDYEIDQVVVSDDFVFHASPSPSAYPRGALWWRIGPASVGPASHTPIALGMACRALQEIAALAQHRNRQDGAYPTVADQPLFQHDLALREAELSAARALFYSIAARCQADVASRGGPLAPELADHVKQTARYVHDVAIRCVDFAYDWSGSAGLRKGSVISRLFKNTHAINQHIFVDRNALIAAAHTVISELAAGAADFARPVA